MSHHRDNCVSSQLVIAVELAGGATLAKHLGIEGGDTPGTSIVPHNILHFKVSSPGLVQIQSPTTF